MADFFSTDGGVALISGVFAVIALVVGDLLRRQNKVMGEVREHSAAAREQVQNSHKTNLRDDIDELKAGVAALLVGFTSLTQDLAWERRERMDVAARVSRLEGAEAA